MGEVPKRRLVPEQSRSSRWLHARGNKTLAYMAETSWELDTVPNHSVISSAKACGAAACPSQKGLEDCLLIKQGHELVIRENWLSRLKRYSRVCGQVRAVTSV